MSTTTSSHSHAFMAWPVLLLLRVLVLLALHAPVRAAAVEAELIGRDRGEHVGRVMSYGSDPRGERNSNPLLLLVPRGEVRANTTSGARNKDLSEVVGHLSNNDGTHTALLLIIGILVPLSLLAIWVLFRDRKTKSPLGGLSNDPEHQVGEHQSTAYPLRLVSPSPPPPPSPSRPGSAIIPPPVAHRNGRNKQPPRRKTHNTSSLTSTGARSTAPAKTGEGAEILSHLPIYVKLKRDKLLQHRHEEGKANGMRAGREE